MNQQQQKIQYAHDLGRQDSRNNTDGRDISHWTAAEKRSYREGRTSFVRDQGYINGVRFGFN